MSDLSHSEIDIRDILARVDRNQAETRKLIAESDKLSAEHAKLIAESGKLMAESGKLNRDRALAPFIVLAATLGAIAALAPILLRSLGQH